MAIKTRGGTAQSQVNAKGLIGATTNGVLLATNYNADQSDLQEPAAQQMLAGLLAGATCTESGLNVTIPSGTTWYARQIWYLDADYIQGVANNVTSWIFGCCDGIIRVTQGSSMSYPSSFDGSTAVLITKAQAVTGVITLTNALQHLARQVNHSTRQVTDGPMVLDYANGIVDVSAAIFRLPEVTSDPSVPGTGAYVWYRSDLSVLKASIDGSVTELLTDASSSPTVTGTSGSALTVDFSGGKLNHTITLTANCTFTFTAPAPGKTVTLLLIQDSGGSKTVTWPASVKWGGPAPTLPTAAASHCVLQFYFDGTNYVAMQASSLLAGLTLSSGGV